MTDRASGQGHHLSAHPPTQIRRTPGASASYTRRSILVNRENEHISISMTSIKSKKKLFINIRWNFGFTRNCTSVHFCFSKKCSVHLSVWFFLFRFHRPLFISTHLSTSSLHNLWITVDLQGSLSRTTHRRFCRSISRHIACMDTITHHAVEGEHFHVILLTHG